ncbi:MAG TPA: HAMP domain-containing sensor histidine kinase, partial [Sphingobacteriaceae bacterium]|nr:HAMP domain-containing sensor histidine kinase [Sphingobacteriaceae bacterium]
TILLNNEFNERNYAIRKIDRDQALSMRDTYSDTLIFVINEQDFEPYRLLKTAFRVQDQYYELQVISSSLEKDDLTEDILYSIIWLYIILLLSVLIINNLVLRKIWSPFYQLLSKIGQFSLDKNPVITSTPTNVKEFKELDERVVRLAEQSAATYSSQKQFLENAAHELQTPLAISINKLELLSEHEDIPQKHLETIGSITNQLQRLTRLNKALLLLTKIENRQFAMQEKVQINPLIRQLVEQFEDLATSKNIQIQLVEVGELVLTAHPDLISILISNLIKNGLVHNISGGQVKVLITEDSFSVSNSAQGAALDPKLIFRRFQKFTSDSQRVGLGLAIVKAICDACNLQVDYSWSNGFHQFSCGLRK